MSAALLTVGVHLGSSGPGTAQAASLVKERNGKNETGISDSDDS